MISSLDPLLIRKVVSCDYFPQMPRPFSGKANKLLEFEKTAEQPTRQRSEKQNWNFES
jgi:hypothetical protein